jgi:hypothetical protein
LFINS